MLKGDLATTPLVEVLRGLAAEAATGCLRISDLEGEEALVFVKGGLVYSVAVPGRRPQLGARLVSSGALAPEALAEALEAQRDELQGWRLGELLVHLGFVEQAVVEAFVTEQLRDGITDLLRWQDGRWKFRKNDKTREDVAPPIPVEDLLVEVSTREDEWAGILQEVHAPTAVPVLSTRGTASPEMMLDGDSWSLLCKIDGERSIAELARDCGLTLFEAGRVVVALVQQGLVDVEEVVEPALSVVSGPPAQPTVEVDSPDDEDSDDHPADMAMRVALAFTTKPSASPVDTTPELPSQDPEPEYEYEPVVAEQPVASSFDMSAIAALVTEAVQSQPAAVGGDSRDDLSMSIARVSAALSDLLGAPATGPSADIFDVPAGLRKPKKSTVAAPKKRTAEDDRRERLRAAAAAELAAAHAEAEASRLGTESQPMADVVSLDKRRQHKADESDAETARAESERLAAEEQTRLEAERVAAVEEAARVAAEEAARVEAERIAAEEEAARLAAEEEAARLAAEEEAARVAAEEAARVEAERIAAEEEAARVAAEEAARVEAERIAAEEEAARLEAEEAARLAAEEAARVAAEEEAARLAAEEAARVAAEEEAARLAAEEAARVEAERIAAEEAARLAAEEEAARLAAEEAARVEAERLAAEEEAARLAAEESARIEAELAAQHALVEEQAAIEAARIEAERVAAEAAEAERAAELEAERLEQEQARARKRDNAAASSELTHLSADLIEVDEEFGDPIPAEPEPDEELYAPLSEQTDTAALLRELSSLGLEDDAPPTAARTAAATASRPVQAPVPKKRKGLFGR